MISQALAFATLVTPVVASPSTGLTRFEILSVTIRNKGVVSFTIEIREGEFKARGFRKRTSNTVVNSSVYYELGDWSEATCTVEVTPR